MAYLEFPGEDGPFLVELSQSEVLPAEGVLKAGIAERIQDNLVRAQTTFDRALATLIRNSAGAFVRAAKTLDDVPDQIEVSFGIMATGELGNLAVGKLSADTNYSVKLTWSLSADDPAT